jgi:hypothetical protein
MLYLKPLHRVNSLTLIEHPLQKQFIIISNKQMNRTSLHLKRKMISKCNLCLLRRSVPPRKSHHLTTIMENSFSEEDFLLLAEILDEQTKQRQSGVKKPRISTNSQSLNELLELL